MLNTDRDAIIRHPTQLGPITRGLTHKHRCPHERDEVIARGPYGELCWPPTLCWPAHTAITEADLYLEPSSSYTYFWSQACVIFYTSLSLCCINISWSRVEIWEIRKTWCVCVCVLQARRTLNKGLLEGDLHSPEVCMLLIIFFIFCRVRWSVSRDCNETDWLLKITLILVL